MKYRKLGSTGVAVSRLGLGTMYFGDETSEADAIAILDAFVDAGGNLIDTADVYAKNESEKIIGRWLTARGQEVRDRIVLTSKGRNATDFGDTPDVNSAGLSRLHLNRALDASLQRLGVETIDLYQLHSWDPHTPVEETLSFLDRALRAGKIQYIGLSNYTGWQLQLFVSTAKEMGVPLPATLQQQYSLLSRESEWEVIPAALHNGIGLLPWSPLAGGFLTGKYERGATPASNTRSGSEKGLYRGTSAEYAELDRNWRTIDAVKRFAAEMNVLPGSVALSWLLQRPGVSAPIIGARNLAQLKQNLEAIDLALDDAMIKELDAVSKPVPWGYPYGTFGVGQRSRWLQDGTPPPGPMWSGDPDHPLGEA